MISKNIYPSAPSLQWPAASHHMHWKADLALRLTQAPQSGWAMQVGSALNTATVLVLIFTFSMLILE